MLDLRSFQRWVRLFLYGYNTAQQTYCLLHASFLLDLLFDTEDGGGMLLRNVSWLLPDYTALYPRR
jgi:hypothetical protein